MIKAKLWGGGALCGRWDITLKIDGVRALWVGGSWVSRANKPLYNMPAYAGIDDVEVFCGSFKETIAAIRAPKSGRLIQPSELYSLDPLDPRLHLASVEFPTKEHVAGVLAQQLALGHEGLVLRQNGVWLKVKPFETHDVEVTGQVPGTGKHEGRMGALVTPMGKVGTGFTDAEREADYVGKTIEVYCMQLTEDGRFRHPRFIRVREDK